MANTPSNLPLLAEPITERELFIVDEALTAYETAHRYAGTLDAVGPDRDQHFRTAQTTARLLERLALNRASERGTPA